MLKRYPVLLVLLMFVVHCAPVAEEIVLPTATVREDEVVVRSIPSPDTLKPTVENTPRATNTPRPTTTNTPRPAYTPIPRPPLRIYASSLMEFIQERKVAGDTLAQVIQTVSEQSNDFHKIEENISLNNQGKEVWFIPTTIQTDHCYIFVVQDDLFQQLYNRCNFIIDTIDYDGDGFEEPLLGIVRSSISLSFIDERDGKYEIVHLAHPQRHVYLEMPSVKDKDGELIVDGKTRAGCFGGCRGMLLTQHEISRFVYEHTTSSLNLVDQDISSMKIEYSYVNSQARFMLTSKPNQETEYPFDAGYGNLFHVSLSSENDAVKLRVERGENGDVIKSDAWPPVYLGVSETEHYTFITSNELQQTTPYTMTVTLLQSNLHEMNDETHARQFIRRADIFLFEDEQIRPILAEKGFDYLLDE